MSLEVGNLEKLEQLMRSSVIDLVRKFNAKKVVIGNQEFYRLDINHIPWMSILKLDEETNILNSKLLINVHFKDGDLTRIPIGVELVIGYLLQLKENLYYVIGVVLVNRKPMFKYRKIKLDIPLDIQIMPKYVTYPEIYAIVKEEKFRSQIVLEIDVEQLKLIDIDYNRIENLKTNTIASHINFTSFLNKFKLNIRVESI